MGRWDDFKLINLYQETLDDLESVGKTPEDVEWVGTANGIVSRSWSEFAEFARQFDYDNDYGRAEVPEELVVVGKGDWWLERYVYDGAENWVFKQKPTRQLPAGKTTRSYYSNETVNLFLTIPQETL